MRIKLCRSWSCLVKLLLLGMCGSAYGQNAFYTFTTGQDGLTTWPASFNHNVTFFTLDDANVGFTNHISNPIKVDHSFEAIGFSPLFGPTNNALWGNNFGFNSGDVEFNLSNSDPGPVQRIEFDFAWANENNHAPASLGVQIFDSDGDSSSQSYALSIFTAPDYGGGFNSRTGHIVIKASDLGLLDLDLVRLNLAPVANFSNFTEFGIDNFRVGDPPPNNSDLQVTYNNGTEVFTSGIATNVLKFYNSGTMVFPTGEVQNITNEATSYSILTTGAFGQINGVPHENLPIGGLQTLPEPSFGGQISTSQNSGQYTGTVSLHNEQNANDADFVVNAIVKIYDPVSLTHNTGTLIDLENVDTITSANAAPLAHAGALRAAAKVIGRQVIGEGFFVDGLEINELIMPGTTAEAYAGFDPVGMVAGVYNGQFRVNYQMVASEGLFGGPVGGAINGNTILPLVTWTLSATVTENTAVDVDVDNGQNLGTAGIGIRNGNTAADIVAGISSSAQSVVAQFSNLSGPFTAPIIGTPMDLTLLADYYVLQMTYSQDDVPENFDELNMRIDVFDTAANGGNGAWIHAILLNSDGGAGASFFEGSYTAYLTDLGGSTPELSAYGVDTFRNHVWAVLDHNSTFGIEAVPEPGTTSLLLVGFAAAMVRRKAGKANR